MLQAIVFDFDGVIVDSEPLHYRALLSVVEPLGVRFDYRRYLREYIGYDDRDFFLAVARDFNLRLDDSQLDLLILQKATAFEHIARQGVQALPGAVELITAAASAMPIALCSGALRRDIDVILPALDSGKIPAMFRTMVTAEQVARSKPDPESYRLAVKRLDLPAAACLAIEDTPAGVASARGAGLRVLAVSQSVGPEPLAAADRVVPTLADVTLQKLHAWFGEM